MDYTETLEFLFSRLPMFQRIGPAAYKNNLDNTVRLDNYYGNPHRKFKTIHVGGTNGKGSVSHMLAAVLQSAGYKTGLYTSPHLSDFRERIRVNGDMIPKQEVIKWVDDYKQNNEEWNIQPSFFELTVAMAFDYFARCRVDVAVVEVGLGGRLDSTNIITPEVSVITNIGHDHTALLGDTFAKIATEKAGIIKRGIPVVIGETHPDTKDVFIETAALKLSPIFFADREFEVTPLEKNINGNQVFSVKKNDEIIFEKLQLDLNGLYQRKNLPMVLKAVEILQSLGWNISKNNFVQGVENAKKMTGLRGRWQILGYNPLIVCDTGHNQEGIAEVVKQIKLTKYRKLHFVFGVVKDKNPGYVLELLPKDAKYYFTRAKIKRALDEKELAEIAENYGLKGDVFSSVRDAFDTAKENAGPGDMVFVGGSTYIVAEIF